MEQRRIKPQNRYFPTHLPKQEGEYPLNVTDPRGSFFLPKQPPFAVDFSVAIADN